MKKLVVVEGLDGSGKSTQVKMLGDYFAANSIECTKIKLPDYDSPSSTLVNMYLAGEFGTRAEDVNAYAAGAFYAVDRFASFSLKWKKDYEAGKLILADRYTTSNFIYQMGKLPNEGWDEYIEWSSDFEYNKINIPQPDVVIFLDMPVEISAGLLSKRYEGEEQKKDVHEKNVEFLNKCRESALYVAKKQGWNIVKCSDRVKPYSPQKIHEEIVGILKEKYAGI